MFNKDTFRRYDNTDATLEIIIMLLIAFVLGYLFRYFMNKRTGSQDEINNEETNDLQTQLTLAKNELAGSRVEHERLRKELIFEFHDEIDALKVRLEAARSDLENSLSQKATLEPETNEKIIVKVPANPNDLKIIEGIGPAIEKILKQGGITSFELLAASNESSLREILSNAGSRFKVHDPSTWPLQASMALNGDWEELKRFQEELNGGKV